MKCFNHPVNDALGICKNCNKGLCKECLTELENGIACTATCIDEVNLINSLINKNKQSYRNVHGVYSRNAYLFGIMGFGFIIFGFVIDGMTAYFLTFGAIFIIGSVFNIINANRYKNKKMHPTV